MQASTVTKEGPTPASVQAFASRNLQLLRAIETTIDSLAADCEIIHTLCDDMAQRNEKLRQSMRVEKMDPEGRTVQLLAQCADSIGRIHADAQRRRQSAVDDKQLKSEDGVVEAYDDYLEALNRFHDGVAELHDLIETHDALLEKPSDVVYGSADELFKALGIPA